MKPNPFVSDRSSKSRLLHATQAGASSAIAKPQALRPGSVAVEIPNSTSVLPISRFTEVEHGVVEQLLHAVTVRLQELDASMLEQDGGNFSKQELQSLIEELKQAQAQLEGWRAASTDQVARLQLELQATRLQRDQALSNLHSIYDSNYWYWLDWYWAKSRALRRYGLWLPHYLKQILRRVLPLSLLRKLSRLRRQYLSFDSSLSTRQVARLLAGQANQNKYDVICFPVIDWQFRWQRPQQIMQQYAAAGHRVFYLNQFFRATGRPYRVTKVSENVFEVSLRGPHHNVYTDALPAEGQAQLLSALNVLRRELSISAAVSCVQLPFWLPLAQAARSRFAWPFVYDCMDYHAGFSNNQQPMLALEQELLREADAVVVSSASLQEMVAKTSQVKACLIRNAADYHHFATVPFEVGASERQVTIGYYGAIAEWFDLELVVKLAQEHPQYRFQLIGAITDLDLSHAQKLPNIEFLGEQPFDRLPGLLHEIDVLLLPFKRNALTEATNPVKAYEILAAGKPLVSVSLPEMVELGDLVYLADTPAEFCAQITRALEEHSPVLVAKRREFAAQNTWQQRFEAWEPVTRNAFPLASIIIVTYNNLELNKLCLHSIYQQTEWGNFEVIVVDNASTDGTVEYLQQAAEQYPNLKVIYNVENAGFAKANNQGLRLARGAYLTLLNNDTVVCRGWLSNLIRHLAADSQLGLGGPVTNEIGNEAKIPVGYKNLEAMPDWAREYMREHDNDVFDIPMLAMYCVAMRRAVYEQVGPLDEQFGIGMFEDDDYARRIRELGYRVRCANDVFIHHAGKASFKLLADDQYQAIFNENRQRYERKWQEPWKPHQGIRQL